MSKYLSFFLCLMLLACEDTVQQELLENAPEARLIVPEKIISPEERDLENKIANRTLLQTIVDGSEKFQKTVLSFECNNHTGGILTLIKDGDALKGIRFAISQEGGNEFVSLYYQKDELAFVVHEKGVWEANQEKDSQTIFYLDKGNVIRCLRKTASGATEKMEQLIQQAVFEQIDSDAELLQKIKDYEDLFVHQAKSDNLATLFCH